jgi:hypothetical protein
MHLMFNEVDLNFLLDFRLMYLYNSYCNKYGAVFGFFEMNNIWFDNSIWYLIYEVFKIYKALTVYYEITKALKV